MEGKKKEAILQVRLEKRTHTQLKILAAEKDTSMSELIKKAIEKLVKTA